VLIAALVVSFVLIAFKAFFWHLIHLVTPFLMPLLLLMVWGIFCIIAIWSIIHLLRQGRFRRFKPYIPLLVQLASLVIVITVPFTSIMLDLDFRLHLKKREEVVHKVISGELQPNVAHSSSLIRLPREYGYLSKGGGEIMVERSGETIYVFFFTYRGVLDNFAGFMYRSDDSSPRDGDFGGDFFVKKRLRKNWYYTSAH
jgi:hypothetical protein